MVKVHHLRIDDFGEKNYAYLVTDETSGASALVDPAAPDSVRDWVKGMKPVPRLEQIWTTHHHPDHANGNLDLLGTHSFLKVYGSLEDKERIPGLTVGLSDRQEWKLGALSITALVTKGHTRGSICYYVVDELKNETCVFTGDTLFIAGCGRFFEGSPGEMYESLCKVLAPLPPATRVYGGHEYTLSNLRFAGGVEPDNVAIQKCIKEWEGKEGPFVSWIGREGEINPFLRVESESLKKKSGVSDPVVLTGLLRSMKNEGKTSFPTTTASK